MMLTRSTTMRQAWDCILTPSPQCKRHTDCGTGTGQTNYGRSSVRITHTVIDEARSLAIVFDWSTGLYLPETPDNMTRRASAGAVEFHMGIRPAWYDGAPTECTLVDECWPDMGFLIANDVLDVLARSGEDAMWGKLERFWVDQHADMTGERS